MQPINFRREEESATARFAGSRHACLPRLHARVFRCGRPVPAGRVGACAGCSWRGCGRTACRTATPVPADLARADSGPTGGAACMTVPLGGPCERERHCAGLRPAHIAVPAVARGRAAGVRLARRARCRAAVLGARHGWVRSTVVCHDTALFERWLGVWMPRALFLATFHEYSCARCGRRHHGRERVVATWPPRAGVVTRTHGLAAREPTGIEWDPYRGCRSSRSGSRTRAY